MSLVEGLDESGGIPDVGLRFPGLSFQFVVLEALPGDKVMEFVPDEFGVEDLLDFPFRAVREFYGRWRSLLATGCFIGSSGFEEGDVEDRMDLPEVGR